MYLQLIGGVHIHIFIAGVFCLQINMSGKKEIGDIHMQCIYLCYVM